MGGGQCRRSDQRRGDDHEVGQILHLGLQRRRLRRGHGLHAGDHLRVLREPVRGRLRQEPRPQAAVVDSYISKDKAGNEYLNVETLARAADGNEGGRHNLFKAAVKGGKLYVCKTQAGDKRWSRGTSKECKVLANSFELA